MAMADSEIFTIDEISAYLKLTKGTIYKLCQGRKVPYFKAGKQLRFSKKSIDRWIVDKERAVRNKKRVREIIGLDDGYDGKGPAVSAARLRA